MSLLEFQAMCVVLGDMHIAHWNSGLVNLLAKVVWRYMKWRGIEDEFLQKYWH